MLLGRVPRHQSRAKEARSRKVCHQPSSRRSRTAVASHRHKVWPRSHRPPPRCCCCPSRLWPRRRARGRRKAGPEKSPGFWAPAKPCAAGPGAVAAVVVLHPPWPCRAPIGWRCWYLFMRPRIRSLCSFAVSRRCCSFSAWVSPPTSTGSGTPQPTGVTAPPVAVLSVVALSPPPLASPGAPLESAETGLRKPKACSARLPSTAAHLRLPEDSRSGRHTSGAGWAALAVSPEAAPGPEPEDAAAEVPASDTGSDGGWQLLSCSCSRGEIVLSARSLTFSRKELSCSCSRAQ
mmetsp:Transcript_87317/g.264900  ORF Transcript_87317/g.264900 Transcript_87317/m.264900 type:complete len:291 (+) Transcript_87317:1500-2372(+)